MLRDHDLKPPHVLIKCDVVADIGCGIRPMQWYPPKRHILVEPFQGYVDILRQHLRPNQQVMSATAYEYLSTCGPLDAIYLLDVIEHMDKAMGWKVIARALEKARQQIVIFTPDGFMPQFGDAWELGGDYWQQHRSGWTAQDFKGWTIERVKHSFFAVWTK
jgi:hypothetical protein